METICSEAPGKIILYGEHFVVKGKPALAAAVQLYAKATITPADKGYTLYSRNLGLKTSLDGEVVPNELKPFQKIYEIVSRKHGKPKPFYAEIDSRIPIGAGMGSSAATSVAFTHSLLEYIGAEYSREDVSRIAYEAEKITHGKPSGIDNTVSTYGGIIYYKAGSLEKLTYKFPEDAVIIGVDTRLPRNTRILVDKVLKRYDKYPEILSKIYDAAEKIVEKALDALRGKDIVVLGELMDINHGLLASIGVSNRIIEDIRYLMIDNGALGAKLTGAGGGGLVIGITTSGNIQKIIYKLNNEGFGNIYVLRIDNDGVRKCIQYG